MLLTKYKLYKFEKKRIVKKGGRNNQGKITVRHHGKGHKRAYRTVSWSNTKNNSLLVGLVYNPTTMSNLLQFFDPQGKKFFYLLAPLGVSSLDMFSSEEHQQSSFFWQSKLADLEIGQVFYNLQVPNKKLDQPQYIRANGCYGKILQKHTWIKNYSLILFPSGEQKLMHSSSLVNKGMLSNFSHFYESIKKAGRNRWLGKRPSVRGVAMNPIDHPHGGGEGKTSGGRPSVSFKGKLTKNVKTSKKKRKNSWQRIKYA